MHFSYLNKAANGEFLDLYLNLVFKKILLIKRLLFWTKKEKWNETKFWTFSWTFYTWNTCNVKNATIFFYCQKTTVCKITNFNTGTVNAIQNKFVKLHEMEKRNLNFDFITLLLQLSFACNPTLPFNIEKNHDIYHSSPHVSAITGNFLIVT